MEYRISKNNVGEVWLPIYMKIFEDNVLENFEKYSFIFFSQIFQNFSNSATKLWEDTQGTYVSHNIHQNGKRFMGTVLFHKAFATGQKNACIGQTNNCEKKKNLCWKFPSRWEKENALFVTYKLRLFCFHWVAFKTKPYSFQKVGSVILDYCQFWANIWNFLMLGRIPNLKALSQLRICRAFMYCITLINILYIFSTGICKIFSNKDKW